MIAINTIPKAASNANSPNIVASNFLDDGSNPTYDGQQVVLADTITNFSKQQYAGQATITETLLAIDWDLDDAQAAFIQLSNDTDEHTLNNPTNQHAGATYTLIIKNSSGGGETLVYDTNYYFPGGTGFTINTDADSINVLTFLSDGTHMLGVGQANFQGT